MKSQVRRARRKTQNMFILLDELHGFDIHVRAAREDVMIFVNQEGRGVVKELWSDVEWTTDERFAEVYSSEWLFTHMRMPKLSPALVPEPLLEFASLDQLGMAVAIVFQKVAEPRRVACYTGQGTQMQLNMIEFEPRDVNSASDTLNGSGT